MSIARTLEGKLSATLALISIIGWLVVAVVDMYRVGVTPDVITGVIILGLGVIAYQFYREDKVNSKDPAVQKARIEASIEMYLDKLAKYKAESIGADKFDNPIQEFLDILSKLKLSSIVGIDESDKEVIDAKIDEESRELF